MTVRKERAKRGEPVMPGDSQRDVAAKLGISRRQIWQMKKIASIPAEEFEALVESDDPPTVTGLLDLAHHRAKSVRHCPHCGGAL